MSYVTGSDIETRLGATAFVQLTDDAGTGSANIDVVDEAREGAEGEVNSYLAHRYAVPVDLSAHPDSAAWLKTVVLDLVEQRLHARRPPVPEAIDAKRRAALEWLERVAAGKVELPAATAPMPHPDRGFQAASAGNTRVLSHDEMDGF